MTDTVILTKAASFHDPVQNINVVGWLRPVGILLFVLACSSLAQAQPPRLGPPTYKSDQQQIGVANYSPGLHKLQTTKRYWVPPGPRNTKPYEVKVPANELTYNVSYANPNVLRQP